MPVPQTDRSSLIITGGSGLIGSRLVRRFAPHYQVFALDVDEPDEELPSGARFLEFDLTSDAGVRQAISRVDDDRVGPIASVVHLAAYYDFSGEPSPLYEEVTVRGTERLLREVQRLPVEQFLFSSTLLVHAPTEPGRPITEESPLEAKWDYPQSKIDTERIIREQRGRIPAVLLRLAGAYSDVCDSIPIANQRPEPLAADERREEATPASTSRSDGWRTLLQRILVHSGGCQRVTHSPGDPRGEA